MKVLITTPDLNIPGGVSEFVRMYIKNTSKQTRFRTFGVGTRPGDQWRIRGLLKPLGDAVKLMLEVRSGEYDLVHLNPSMGIKSILREGLFLLALRAARFKNVVIFFHGWNEELANKIASTRLFRSIFRFVYNWPKHTMVLSPDFKKTLLQIGIQENAIEVTTTMFDGNELALAKKPKQQQKIKILFMSRLIRGKGIYELLSGFFDLCQKESRAVLVIAGDGPEREGVKAEIDKSSFGHRVEYVGHVTGNRKTALLSEASVFILPSYEEGCPVAMLEAMAAGLPVVVTQVGGIPNIIQDGINGRIIRSLEPRTISNAVYQLLSDSEAIARMGDTNRIEAWARYEAKSVAAHLESISMKTAGYMTSGDSEAPRIH